METWLLLTIVTVFAAGFNAFIYKVAAKEHMDIYVMNFFMTMFSSIGTLIFVLFFASFSGHSWLILLIAFGTSLFYFGTTVTKVNALQSIDSTLFFPIYKVLGPTVVIFFGIILFREQFTAYEWIGLILSLLVPIMLITKAESTRQSDLKRGLLYLVVTVIFGTFSHIFWKYGSDIASNPWLFIIYIEFTTFLISAIVVSYKYRGSLAKNLPAIKGTKFLQATIVSGIMNIIAGASVVFAFVYGGALGIVNTVGSLYILIPIILSIIFYGEHWNARKVIAIILSIAALIFFI